MAQSGVKFGGSAVVRKVVPFPKLPDLIMEEYEGEKDGMVWYSICSRHHNALDVNCKACIVGEYHPVESQNGA